MKPLIYEVYAKDAIEVDKTWNDALMVGTFKLKLREPEPVKRVLKHIRVGESTKTCEITLTSTKYVNIYWGDGSVDYDVAVCVSLAWEDAPSAISDIAFSTCSTDCAVSDALTSKTEEVS